MVKKKNENLELAEEHIKIAEDLVTAEAKKASNSKLQEKLTKTEFDLERSEADLDEISEEDFDEEIDDEK